MALPLRGTAKSGTATNGGDVTLTFDTGGGAPVQGDVVILFGGHGVNSATAAGPITAGYTAIHVDANAPDRGAWYKVMGASPDTDVQGEGGANASDAVAYGAFVLNGSLIDAAIFDQTSVETTEGTRVPNAGSIVTQTNGAWVVAIGMNRLVDTSPGVPSGYTTIIGASANDSSDMSIDAAYIEKVTAGAEDPPAWSTWSSGNSYEVTLAIKPAAGPVTTPQAIAATAIGTPALAAVVTYSRALVATAVGVPALARVVTYLRALAATAVGGAALVKKMFATLAATAVGSATLASASVVGQAIAATAVGVATITSALVIGVTASATAVGAATLAAAIVIGQTVAATAIGAASLVANFIAGTGGAIKANYAHLVARVGALMNRF